MGKVKFLIPLADVSQTDERLRRSKDSRTVKSQSMRHVSLVLPGESWEKFSDVKIAVAALDPAQV